MLARDRDVWRNDDHTFLGIIRCRKSGSQDLVGVG